MLYYLDTVIVIYAVEGNPADKKRAKDHLDALEQAGHRFAISELTRTECLVPVFGQGDGQRMSDFFRFFHEPNLRTLSLTAAMHARASAIRGGHSYPAIPPAQPKRYGLADALHPVFLAGVPIIAIAFIATLFIPEVPLRQTAHVAAGKQPAAQ